MPITDQPVRFDSCVGEVRQQPTLGLHFLEAQCVHNQLSLSQYAVFDGFQVYRAQRCWRISEFFSHGLTDLLNDVVGQFLAEALALYRGFEVHRFPKVPSRAVQPRRILLDVAQCEQDGERNESLPILDGRQGFQRIVNLCDNFVGQGDGELYEFVSRSCSSGVNGDWLFITLTPVPSLLH
jgi:hypothetical protein